MKQLLQTLYRELTSGTRECSETGQVTLRPPTSLALRAARTLDTFSKVNDTNLELIKQLQHRGEEFVRESHAMCEEINQLLAQQKIMYSQLTTKDQNERVRDGKREAGSVDSGTATQSDLPGRNPGSETNDANSNSSIGGN